jgi:hypothetical protein
MVSRALTVVARVQQVIQTVRGHNVLLDGDLASLYGVDTKALLRAVRRNIERFPPDFMIQLTHTEFESLRYQSGTSKGRGGRRYLPYAFTEQGVAMLSSVLNSPRAIAANIAIMRAFVDMRQAVAVHRQLSRRIDSLERRYDGRFQSVFRAIKRLLQPAKSPKRRIGFRS